MHCDFLTAGFILANVAAIVQEEMEPDESVSSKPSVHQRVKIPEPPKTDDISKFSPRNGVPYDPTDDEIICFQKLFLLAISSLERVE